MQRFALLFPLFGLVFLTTNCSKDNSLRSLAYTEIKCGIPWNTNRENSNAEVEIAVTNFLENNLMIPNSRVEATFDANEAQGCKACNCKTGRKIVVEVEKGFVPILEDNGFTLIK